MDAGLLPPCEWPAESRDEYGCVPFSLFAKLIDTCSVGDFDGGLCFTMSLDIHDKHGHLLDGDNDPLGEGGCQHKDTPEWKAEHQEEVRMETNEAVSVTPAPVLGETTTTVGVDTAITQVKQLVPGGADASPALLIGGAATLAVVGAAIKFGPQVLKSRHEARMKELELKQEQQSKEDDKHQACAVERAALEAKVVALESKIAGLESKKSEEGFDFGDIDFGDLKDRLEKLEKTVAPPKKRGRPPKGKA